MPITLHLVRHAQGFHNLNQTNEAIPDPYLTPLGLQQCADLLASFPYHDRITHLVASPMRRTLLTCYHSFTPSVNSSSSGNDDDDDDDDDDGKESVMRRTTRRGKKIIALPLVQEVTANPCDTGSEPVVLRAEYGRLREDAPGWMDDSQLARGWNDKGPGSKYQPTPERLEARAREARQWLRALGRNEAVDGSADIVVVTHGGFLHFLTQDWDGMDLSRGTGWSNTEWRSYEFVDVAGDDAEASIRETKPSWRRRRGSAIRLTETEQRQARAVVIEAVRAVKAAPKETNGDESKSA